LSHRDTHKKIAHDLSAQLTHFGISSFVAHDTIEPDATWKKEIEKALSSMEVMIAIVTDDFFESTWTNQEVGFALGRDVPVISIKFGSKAPKGFISDIQAHVGIHEKLDENAHGVYSSIVKRLIQNKRIREVVLNKFAKSTSFAMTGSDFRLIDAFDNFEQGEIEFLIESFNENSQINSCYFLTDEDRFPKFLKRVSGEEYRIQGDSIELHSNTPQSPINKDEMPF
jgi:hypothetical protein